jgi:Sec-independent protein translocase protein TatA
MELFLVAIIAVFLLKPEDIHALAKWLGKLWRLKNNWQQHVNAALNSLEKHDKP